MKRSQLEKIHCKTLTEKSLKAYKKFYPSILLIKNRIGKDNSQNLFFS